MGEVIRGLVLGVVQGLTEFFPVSSSGHEQIASRLLSNEGATASELLLLHAGSLLALLFRLDQVFDVRAWREIRPTERAGPVSRYAHRVASLAKRPFGIGPVLVATAISGAGLIALALTIDSDRVTLPIVALLFAANGLVLQLGSRTRSKAAADLPPSAALTWPAAAGVGVAQAIAGLPGLSRLGLTVAATRFHGASYDDARRFSLQIAIPVLAGAVPAKVVLDLLTGEIETGAITTAGLVGAGASFLAARLALDQFLKWSEQLTVRVFVIWSVLASIAALAVSIAQ